MDASEPGPPGRASVTSGAAAILIVLAAVFVWWLLSGNGPQGPGGNDPRLAVPDVTASAAPGATPSGPVLLPGGVRIESYVLLDELRLSLNYRLADDCVGELGSPRVLETEAAVTLTLTVSQGECAGAAQPHTLAVLLDSPLRDRSVLDGSTSPQVRVERTGTAYE